MWLYYMQRRGRSRDSVGRSFERFARLVPGVCDVNKCGPMCEGAHRDHQGRARHSPVSKVYLLFFLRSRLELAYPGHGCGRHCSSLVVVVVVVVCLVYCHASHPPYVVMVLRQSCLKGDESPACLPTVSQVPLCWPPLQEIRHTTYDIRHTFCFLATRVATHVCPIVSDKSPGVRPPGGWVHRRGLVARGAVAGPPHGDAHHPLPLLQPRRRGEQPPRAAWRGR